MVGPPPVGEPTLVVAWSWSMTLGNCRAAAAAAAAAAATPLSARKTETGEEEVG